MDETPMVSTYMGKNIEGLTREELIEALSIAVAEIKRLENILQRIR